MHNLFVNILDAIFPPRAETIIVRRLTPQDIQLLYTPLDFNGTRVLSDFKHPYIRSLIHEAKFYGNERAFHLLGILMDNHMKNTSIPIDIIVPLPLSSTRRRVRGFNQVTEILKTTDVSITSLIKEDILYRTRDTRPQTELKRADRLTNVQSAFEVKNPKHVSGKNILLIDDVLTTGATLKAANDALLIHSPASIMSLAFAH